MSLESPALDLDALELKWRNIQPYLAGPFQEGQLVGEPLAEYFADLVEAAPQLFKRLREAESARRELFAGWTTAESEIGVRDHRIAQLERVHEAGARVRDAFERLIGYDADDEEFGNAHAELRDALAAMEPNRD